MRAFSPSSAVIAGFPSKITQKLLTGASLSSQAKRRPKAMLITSPQTKKKDKVVFAHEIKIANYLKMLGAITEILSGFLF